LTDNLLQESTENTLDPNKSYFEQLVGEQAKFKDPEALAKGKYEADMYIKILERQLDQTKTEWQRDRDENNTRAKLQDLLDKIQNTNLNSTTTPNTSETNTQPFDLTQLDSIVSSKLEERERSRKEQDNLKRVQKELTEKFGNRLNDHLQEIGLDGESAAKIAKTNPELLLKALGTNQQQQQSFQAPPRNSSGFTPSPPKQRTWSYYQEQFKKDPKLYHDQKINIQMQKDYIALGSAFEDGDFKRFGDGISSSAS
jgi:hypothetical protein